MATQRSILRKRRGVVRASVTRLGTRIEELEDSVDQPRTPDHARQCLTKLQSLDNDFRKVHMQVIDLIDETDNDSLGAEQLIMDSHDDAVANFTVKLESLITTTIVAPTASTTLDRRPSTRKLARIRTGLNRICHALTSDPPPVKSSLLQYQTELADYRRDITALYDELVKLDIGDDDAFFTNHTDLETLLSDVSHELRKCLVATTSETPPAAVAVRDSVAIKLPKLEVPTFSGDLLHWKQFWDQFSVAVHDRTHMSNAEKIVYLQQAVKDGNASSAIEGLAHSGDNYAEAVECLRSRFDKPRLIQRTHVQTIIDAPTLKDGSGKELRRLHDCMQQHLRALKTMGCDLPSQFLTSMIELKLDVNTLFEWQKHSQEEAEVPEYRDLLDFIDLRAQASETRVMPRKPPFQYKKPISKTLSHATVAESYHGSCVVCKEKHPLYTCAKFKAMSHEDKFTTLKINRLCTNCLGSGHFRKQCKSLHKCKLCQRTHHTLLHDDSKAGKNAEVLDEDRPLVVPSNASIRLTSNTLLMTCRVRVTTPDGSSVEARALLDNASSASFISERLVQSLSLTRSHQDVRVSGIGGVSHKTPLQSVSSFQISPANNAGRSIQLTAVVVPRVTCDLPLRPVPYKLEWQHISDLPLADPGFGQPGRIDLLLGVDVYIDILRHGRRSGPTGSPTAFETEFGWVLCGSADPEPVTAQVSVHVTTFHASALLGDDILRRFWEIEESPSDQLSMTVEERAVMHHFQTNHKRTQEGRFVVPLPKNPEAKLIGESRFQALRRFIALERSLTAKGTFTELDTVMREYLDLGHAEVVPDCDAKKKPDETFYLPIHAVYKASSTTTKVRAVFDASAKSSTGVSLNDTLLIGPTVHRPLIDVLLQFRMHRIALTADISKMYRAVLLTETDRDLHRFLWRSSPTEVLKDYRMTRLTFGVSASSFAANMAVKQNALYHSHELPLAAEAVQKTFYVDDCLTGADDFESALVLQKQLIDLFGRGGFVLRKWNSNDASVLKHTPEELRDSRRVQPISETNEYTKTLGVEWDTSADKFRLSISDLPHRETLTKRILVSDVAKVFDVLGWFSPVTIKMKILLQRVWEAKIEWDEQVPASIQEIWFRWKEELHVLSTVHIPRCYYPIGVSVASIQLHGFSDASEDAYSGVVYLRVTDGDGYVHTTLVLAKTKVAPIKRLSIPRLELCGAQILAKLLFHVKEVLKLSIEQIFAWTDSTVVLGWLSGSPRRFKTYVGNRVSHITDRIPPSRWRHVAGVHNPADCASRGLFPQELKQFELWWRGPAWLQLSPLMWPEQGNPPTNPIPDEEREVCHVSTMLTKTGPILDPVRYSSFMRLKRVTAWIFRFLNNLRKKPETVHHVRLTVDELNAAESYWLSFAQSESYPEERNLLIAKKPLPKNNRLLPFHPILDDRHCIMRVGGRISNSTLSYAQSHPVILNAKHSITKLIIESEHRRLLHAGPTLLISSLNQRYQITGIRKAVRFITRGCVTCRRQSARLQKQLMGPLPKERITSAPVFERVGVDYAGPFLTKYGSTRKPTIVKSYLCLFVCLSVKAVHLELVSDLTTDAFIATLRRFVARRGYPSQIWSDHGTNFVGADRELKQMQEFLSDQITQRKVSEFCTSQNIEWKYIPEKSPHFGGLWESAVKSAKAHLKRVLSSVKLTFEEITTVFAQIEACMNSRPLVPINSPDDDGIEALTPGHFLTGRPLCALPDPQRSYRAVSILQRWHLCQHLIRQHWSRWHTEYICSLNKYNKWFHSERNVAIGDIVLIKEGGIVPTKWPMGRIVNVYPGKDKLVRVVSVKTAQGTYKRPVSKVAILISNN